MASHNGSSLRVGIRRSVLNGFQVGFNSPWVTTGTGISGSNGDLACLRITVNRGDLAIARSIAGINILKPLLLGHRHFRLFVIQRTAGGLNVLEFPV